MRGRSPGPTDACAPSPRTGAAPAAGSSLRRRTVPRPIPGPRQERPVRWQVSWLAGQRPVHGLPRVAPSGWSFTDPVHRARRLQLQGQPRIWRRTSAPHSLLRPLAGPPARSRGGGLHRSLAERVSGGEGRCLLVAARKAGRHHSTHCPGAGRDPWPLPVIMGPGLRRDDSGGGRLRQLSRLRTIKWMPHPTVGAYRTSTGNPSCLSCGSTVLRSPTTTQVIGSAASGAAAVLASAGVIAR